ncbi:hypothetical protein C8R44DRAFT_617481 [Mycena epipterygia]|nr:hypothetical protein C8R44DRAFT_617481 [Mycena epipterygia]
MNRFATRSDRFMDAYRKGLNGLQAAWAGKRYRGHRVLPKNIMALLTDSTTKKNRLAYFWYCRMYIYNSWTYPCLRHTV